ncbi:MAG TPA: RNA polymerase sigma factor [Gemmataceae bacterium]|nr:RNA polymerase sigma factor [Gemmataceae bacterium]
MASLEKSDALLEEEQLLICRAQGGDRQAFAVLVERHWDRLYRWLYHLTHDRHTAEDLTQESLLKAFANLARFRTPNNFHAWLFRIAYNCFVNQWRSPTRARQPFPENLQAPGEGPVEQVLSREALQMLARAVGRLPADFRAAFLLRVDEQLSFQEIAEVLGIREETARWRFFKARQKLMNVLAPQLNREEV